MPRDAYRRRYEAVTPAEILAKLFNAKGLTPERVQKAKSLAYRQRLNWDLVLAAMTEDQRQQVEHT